MSRLKREGNPPSNQLASPVPQAWDPSINDFKEITGQNLGGGRFGADGVQWGKTASGLFVPVRVTNDGVQEVQLSGTIELICHVSINKDTGNAGAGEKTYLGQTPSKTMLGLNSIDLRQYSEVSYSLSNYTNTEVTFTAIGVWQLGVNPVPNGRHIGVVMEPVKVAAGALKPISKDDFPRLKEKLIGIYFEVVPTGDITNTGSVGVRLIGK